MPTIARKLLGSDTIFNFLNSKFIATYDSLIQQELITNENILFEIFKDQADYDGTITLSMYAQQDEAQKKNFGLFRFIGGEVDPNELFNVYLQRYSFELLAFEDYRDDIRNIVTTFASTLNGNAFPLSDKNGEFVAFVQVNEFPIITQTIDANGADKFISSITIDMLFYQDIVHSIGVDFKIDGITIPFSDITFSRKMIEPASDMRKENENKYVPSKTASDITITGYYAIDSGTSAIIDWILDDRNIARPFRVYYNDNNKVKTGVFMVANSTLTIPFEAIIAYNLTLVPYRGQVPEYYGVLAKYATLGSGEYEGGTEVTVVSEREDFVAWEVLEGIITPTGDTSLTTPTLKFIMPGSNVILKATFEE